MLSAAVVAVVGSAASPVAAGPASCPANAPGSEPLAKPSNRDALRQFETGNRAYKLAMDRARPRSDAERDRELDRAIEAYQAGAAIQDVLAFDFNLAQAYRARGRIREAVARLVRIFDCASSSLDASARASIEKRLAVLDPNGTIRAELGAGSK